MQKSGCIEGDLFLSKADKRTPFFLVYLRLSTMAKFPKDYHPEKSENDKKLAVIMKLKKQKTGQTYNMTWTKYILQWPLLRTI
ncbi:DNA topoisomerase 2-binding 1 [Gossypium australe]|uniref:DNA topoisomerase 2-binding 1 n=1 Tax=Gossypium australe TaxID=47621 RepID=A0A5B6X8C7_9ROSI|nr:DNA topoisomerase 2-binding 1 [Gossypium australe]